MEKVGQVLPPSYLQHETGLFHPECPDRLQAIGSYLAQEGLSAHLRDIPARIAQIDEIAWVHDLAYIRDLERKAGKAPYHLDADTVLSSASFEAACWASGGLLEAIDRVFSGELDHAFAMVRPPGHHAERDHGMGFCLFNNVAIAAEYLVRRYGVKRVAIVDFDVHHGNATQHMFYDRSDVFYVSTHRYPFYPGTGASDERGKGAGHGYNLNIPMEAGQGDEAFAQVFQDTLLPALRDYRPEFLLVSAGFDAHYRDPLGGMALTESGFARIALQLKEVARQFCEGKSVYTLEGGYDLSGLSRSVAAVLQVLLQDRFVFSESK